MCVSYAEVGLYSLQNYFNAIKVLTQHKSDVMSILLQSNDIYKNIFSLKSAEKNKNIQAKRKLKQYSYNKSVY